MLQKRQLLCPAQPLSAQVMQAEQCSDMHVSVLAWAVVLA